MTTKRKTKPATIWVGIIPSIFGYGISVAETTEAKAMTALRKAYAEGRKPAPTPRPTSKPRSATGAGMSPR
jgi:hypothetical protein